MKFLEFIKNNFIAIEKNVNATTTSMPDSKTLIWYTTIKNGLKDNVSSQ